MITSMFLLATFAATGPVHKTQNGPMIPDFGQVYKIDDLQVPLDKVSAQKVLFDIYKAPEKPGDLNRRIEGIARFLNMHALHGMDIKKIQIAVVLHGSATRDGLKSTVYKKKYGIENPNLALIQALSQNGVKFYQCGQSAYYHGYNAKDYLAPVRMSLSAMTMLVELQQRGYAIIPW